MSDDDWKIKQREEETRHAHAMRPLQAQRLDTYDRGSEAIHTAIAAITFRLSTYLLGQPDRHRLDKCPDPVQRATSRNGRKASAACWLWKTERDGAGDGPRFSLTVRSRSAPITKSMVLYRST